MTTTCAPRVCSSRVKKRPRSMPTSRMSKSVASVPLTVAFSNVRPPALTSAGRCASRRRGRGRPRSASRKRTSARRDVGVARQLVGELAPAQIAGRDLRDDERVAAEGARARLARGARQPVEPGLHDGRRRHGRRHRQAGERGAQRIARDRRHRLGDARERTRWRAHVSLVLFALTNDAVLQLAQHLIRSDDDRRAFGDAGDFDVEAADDARLSPA